MQNNRPTHQRFILIAILFYHSVNTLMDRVVISSAKDGIVTDLGISDQMMGYVFGIFALGYAMFQIPSGWIADRYGPRKALSVVVGVWSCFTMLTGAAMNAVHMLILRFAFGMGEAGAFPGATRAFYRWLPPKERGLAHGINFSGARLGPAFALFVMPFLIRAIGWRMTFVINGLIGIVWAVIWVWWFRDDPKDNKYINQAELDYIEEGQQQSEFVEKSDATFGQIFVSSNMLLTMYQYTASNMTFYVCFSWLAPYLSSRWGRTGELFAPIPLLVAAASQLISGGLVTWLYNRGYHVGSRRIPAIIGFFLGAAGLLLATQTTNIVPFILSFSIAILGVDMTLSPSWSFCMDIGGKKTGMVSAAMNMAGNIGSAVSAIIFPFFVANVTLPFFAAETGSANSFFIFAAVLNITAIFAWLGMNPRREVNRSLTPNQVRFRVALYILILVGGTVGAILYNLFVK
ncbi:MFS transporter [Candidatus Latescibacterota bacterium]